MIRVIRCVSCGHYCSEADLKTEVVDLENEHGVGGLFPDHHRESVGVCPECGSSSLEEEPDNGSKLQEAVKAGAGCKYNYKFIFTLSMIYLIFLKYMKVLKIPKGRLYSQNQISETYTCHSKCSYYNSCYHHPCSNCR